LSPGRRSLGRVARRRRRRRRRQLASVV
jgi:hypothetical protein